MFCIEALEEWELTNLFSLQRSTFLSPTLLLGCPTAIFGAMLREEPYLSDVNHCILLFWIQLRCHKELRNNVCWLLLTKHPIGFELETIQFICNALTISSLALTLNINFKLVYGICIWLYVFLNLETFLIIR